MSRSLRTGLSKGELQAGSWFDRLTTSVYGVGHELCCTRVIDPIRRGSNAIV